MIFAYDDLYPDLLSKRSFSQLCSDGSDSSKGELEKRPLFLGGDVGCVCVCVCVCVHVLVLYSLLQASHTAGKFVYVRLNVRSTASIHA